MGSSGGGGMTGLCGGKVGLGPHAQRCMGLMSGLALQSRQGSSEAPGTPTIC